eukprot:gene1364-1551_t
MSQAPVESFSRPPYTAESGGWPNKTDEDGLSMNQMANTESYSSQKPSYIPDSTGWLQKSEGDRPFRTFSPSLRQDYVYSATDDRSPFELEAPGLQPPPQTNYAHNAYNANIRAYIQTPAKNVHAEQMFLYKELQLAFEASNVQQTVSTMLIDKRAHLIPKSPELMSVAVSMTQNVLKHVVELEICLDIMTMLGVDQAHNLLLPYVQAWSIDPNPIISERTIQFVEAFRRSRAGANSSPSLQAEGRVNVQASIPAAPPRYKNWSAGSMLSSSSSSPSLAGAPDFNDAESTVQFQKKLMRLELLIRESRGGILGAQIPELYRDRFGEPLDLRNKKLKDVLLCIESVEMFAAKGSGDKIYRVVDDLSSMPMRSAALPATAV